MATQLEQFEVPKVEDVRVATLEEAIAFATDSYNYRPFDLTLPDFNSIYGCVDARSVIPPAGKQNKTIIQTPGGGAGEVDDRIVSEYAMTGVLLTPEDALGQERDLRGTTTMGGHVDCKFEIAQQTIKSEEASPSDQTMDEVERTLHRYNRHKIVMPLMPRIIEAACAQLERLDVHGIPPDFHKQLDRVYDGKRNVTRMFGENKAQVYVVNHSPKVGLDRDKKARMLLNDGVDVQLFHESRGAALTDLIATYSTAENIPASLGPEPSQKDIQRALDFRIGAFTLRSCASETILTGLRPTERFEVIHSTHGLSFNKVS